MKKHSCQILVLFLLIACLFFLKGVPTTGSRQANAALVSHSHLPPFFVKNEGQLNQEVFFYLQGEQHTIFFKTDEIISKFGDGSWLSLQFQGASPSVALQASKPLLGRVNYLKGTDKKYWKTNIQTYSQITYQNLYPGIDFTYSAGEKKLKSEFTVRPGADYKKILLAYSHDVDSLVISDAGDLLVRLPSGMIRETKPVVYQFIRDKKVEVAGQYVVRDKEYGFELSSYDSRYPLIIDPELIYSTYLGGSASDGGKEIAVDSTGYAYVTGDTTSLDFPAPSSLQPMGGSRDVFVTKLSPDGNSLVYSTYLGGAGDDYGNGIAVDSFGGVVVVGETFSDNFPTTENAYQTAASSLRDAFVARLNPAGDGFIYSTYLGGEDHDYAFAVAVDNLGSAYVTGGTYSTNFPIERPVQGDAPYEDVFVTRLSGDGSFLVFSTYIGGNNNDHGLGIALDTTGNVYVAGATFSGSYPTTTSAYQTDQGLKDAFVTKLGPAGNEFVYSTYLGGSFDDYATAIAVDSSENAYVTGSTFSTDFPSTAGAYQDDQPLEDAFVAKINPEGSDLVYSTYLGGDANDSGGGIRVTPEGKVFVAGSTDSSNFPILRFLQLDPGARDIFVTKLNEDGASLVYSTYLGGADFDSASGLAIDSAGNAYITGSTTSTDFPTVLPYQATNSGGEDVFVAKISEKGSDHLPVIPPADSSPPVEKKTFFKRFIDKVRKL